MCEVVYDDGIHLEGTDLWFDSKKKVNLSFISNGNVQNIPKHDRIIATPQTLKFLERKTKNSIVLSCPYNKPFTLGKARIELIPSGYALGASQIVVEIGGRRIIYTGDFKLRYSQTSKYIELRRCDTLIMKCRYGLPKYLFPPDNEIHENIYGFIKETLYFNYVPVIFVDILGKAQDLIQFLCKKKLNISLHRSILRTLNIYKQYNGTVFPHCEVFKINKIKGKVVVFPIHLRGTEHIDRIEKKRTCVISGWAVENPDIIKTTFKVDVAYPLSNHAGYDELIQYVEIVRPKEVFLIEGYCTEFANKLNKMGYKAKPLEKPMQLKLF